MFRSAKGASRPQSQQFDTEKPHWLLRVVVDGSEAQQGECDVKKDTERVEQIRAMKQAWERADPGRAERAAARRAAFLAKYMVPVHPPQSADVDTQPADVSEGDRETPATAEPTESIPEGCS